MANEIHLTILLKGVKVWNKWRKTDPLMKPDLNGANLRGAKLRLADLSRANLRNADLIKANLRGANLDGADISGAKLNGASLSGANLNKLDLSGMNLNKMNLSKANLSGTNLSKACLSNTDLRGADLSGANLNETDLNGTKLSGAHLNKVDLRNVSLNGMDLSNTNLSGTNLTESDLTDTKLNQVNFENVNLTLARLIRCDLTNAFVNKAIIKYANIQDLQGLPYEPEELWLDEEGKDKLIGEEARSFFRQPAIVEVYLTHSLTPDEIAAFHLHLAEWYKKTSGEIHLTRHRHESSGSVLTFQATIYNEIYSALPDLLAPFLQAQAIDWQETIKNVPEEQREELSTHLIKMETAKSTDKWRFAERLPSIFNSFRNAEVKYIKEGRSRGLLIKVATNDEIKKRLEGYSSEKPSSMLVDIRDSHVSISQNKEETIMEGETTFIQFGDGNTFNGDVIAAKNIEHSFNRVNEVKNDKLQELLKALTNDVSKLCEQLENTDDQQQVSRKLKTFVEEAASSKPDTGFLKVTAEGLIEAAKTIAVMAEPITKTVKAILTLFGGSI